MSYLLIISIALNVWMYFQLRDALEKVNALSFSPNTDFLIRATQGVSKRRATRVYTKDMSNPRWQPKKRKYTKNPNNPYWAGRA